VASRLVNGLSSDEFSIPGHFVAEIALAGEPEQEADGSITVLIEALTVEE
jgi:hypothetical protein